MATTAQRGKMIRLKAADGHELGAYRAEPLGAPRGGIVVIQEIFGVNSYIRDVCDRFTNEGYVAVAPAMYDRLERDVDLGYDQDSFKRAQGLRTRLTDWDQSVADAEAAAADIRKNGLRKVAIIGYCYGGEIAWLGVTRGTFDAAVAYYGRNLPDLAGERPKAPAIMHFGKDDHLIPLDGVERIKKAHPDMPVHVYDGAGHGFSCDQRPHTYNEAAAALAQERTMAFLKGQIG